MEKQVIAAFDFDKTITTKDSLPYFLFFYEQKWKAFFKLVACIPYLLGFLLGVISRQKAKEKVLTSFFKGKKIEEIKKMGKLFAKEKLPLMVKKNAIARIQKHQELGHRLILISASLKEYLQPWAKEYGFDDLISSSLQVDKEGRATGKLDGVNCWGEEKVNRLKQLIGKRENYLIYAYGDSKGDQALMNFADIAFYKKMPSPNLLDKI